ncbi:MAG: hypothetical protein KGN76_05020 [Acidobacteriota bacterium]|nr:hypothetical protein [Acidobacteriota bacterium]
MDIPTIPSVRNVNDDTPRREQPSRRPLVPEPAKPGGESEDGADPAGVKPGKRDGVGDHLDIYA